MKFRKIGQEITEAVSPLVPRANDVKPDADVNSQETLRLTISKARERKRRGGGSTYTQDRRLIVVDFLARGQLI
jgi:hypothetical protein